MFLAKLNKTFQTVPKRRKDKIFGDFSLIIGSEILHMLTVVQTSDLVDWLCSLILVIGLSGVQFVQYECLTKSDDREAGVRFVNHEYDYRQNWTTRSPITN